MKRPLVILYGLIGTGKTVRSKYFVMNMSDCVRFSTDEIRRVILGKDQWDPKDTPAVNSWLYSKINEELRNGKCVFIDSANKTIAARERLYKIGRENNTPILVIDLYCKPETAIARISNRKLTKDSVVTNNSQVYYDFAKLVENPEKDLKLKENDDISLIRINTDTNKIEVVKISNNWAADINYFLENLGKTLNLFDERKHS